MRATQQHLNCSTAPLNNYVVVGPAPIDYRPPYPQRPLIRPPPGLPAPIHAPLNVLTTGWAMPMGYYQNHRQASIPRSTAHKAPCKAKPYTDCLDSFEAILLQRERDYVVYNPNAKFIEFRIVLIQWMLNIYEEYEMHTKTIAIACNLLDRVLSAEDAPMNECQLVALCCIMIAAKLEETIDQTPLFEELLQYTTGGYSKQDAIKMEQSILGSLRWNLNAVTPIDFIDIHMERVRADEHVQYIPEDLQQLHRVIKIRQQQLLELVLNDYAFNQWRPSVIGACIFAASRIIIDLVPRWPSFNSPCDDISDLARCIQYLITKFEHAYCSM